MSQWDRLNPYSMRPHNRVPAPRLVLSTKTFITGGRYHLLGLSFDAPLQPRDQLTVGRSAVGNESAESDIRTQPSPWQPPDSHTR